MKNLFNTPIRILCGFGFFLSGTALQAQDIFASNTNQHLLGLNPSFAGSNGGFRVQGNYLGQQLNYSGSRVFYQVSTDFFVEKLGGGLAVALVSKDHTHGAVGEKAVNLTYAQYLRAMDGDLSLIPSLQVQVEQASLDVNAVHFGSNLTWYSPWHSSALMPSSRNTYVSYNAGLLLNYKNRLYAGASGFHLNEPAAGFMPGVKYPMMLNFHASVNQMIFEKSLCQIIYRHTRQFNTWSNQISANFLLNKLVAGAGLRISDWHFQKGTVMSQRLLLLNGGFRFPHFAVNLGCDVNVNNMNSLGVWGMSLHISANFGKTGDQTVFRNFENY